MVLLSVFGFIAWVGVGGGLCGAVFAGVVVLPSGFAGSLVFGVGFVRWLVGEWGG